MCGLAGWIDPHHQTPDDVLAKMLTPLVPRGPDAQGRWQDQSAALGHQRLKVIDLHGGQQPAVSEKSVLIFNGEIYNFQEIKRQLEKHIGTLDCQSDTEILKHALDTWGASSLKKIRGMFAFAYFRRDKNCLLLGRDPMGKKPLFYAHLGDTFVFASTCRSLRQHPKVPGDLNLSELGHYLMSDAPRDGHSLYQQIKAVPAGHTLLFTEQTNQIDIQSFWSWPKNQDIDQPEDAIAGFGERFKKAVRRRLYSDVPLGVFLSGGLDSSAVAWQSREILGSHSKLNTFSIGFREPSFDESMFSQRVAQNLGTDHHHQFLQESELLEVVPDALQSLDQPLADASIVPTWALCRMTRRHVTVALSGDGGDDIMAGYDPFRALRTAQCLRPFLSSQRCVQLKNWFGKQTPRTGNLPWPFKGKQFMRGLKQWGGQAGTFWMSAWDPDMIPQITSSKEPDDWEPFSDRENFDMLHFFRTRYLRDQILVKVDRASMDHSLEVRSPFLDLDLVEWLSRCRWPVLWQNGRGKAPLRRFMENRLPRSIINRPKKGFGIPLARWLRGPLSEWLLDTVNEQTLSSLPLNSDIILKFRDQHLAGQRDHHKELWNLACLSHWLQANRH